MDCFWCVIFIKEAFLITWIGVNNLWNDIHTFACLAVCLFDHPHQLSLELTNQFFFFNFCIMSKRDLWWEWDSPFLKEKSWWLKTAQIYMKLKILACHVYLTFCGSQRTIIRVSFLKNLEDSKKGSQMVQVSPKSGFLKNQLIRLFPF